MDDLTGFFRFFRKFFTILRLVTYFCKFVLNAKSSTTCSSVFYLDVGFSKQEIFHTIIFWHFFSYCITITGNLYKQRWWKKFWFFGYFNGSRQFFFSWITIDYWGIHAKEYWDLGSLVSNRLGRSLGYDDDSLFSFHFCLILMPLWLKKLCKWSHGWLQTRDLWTWSITNTLLAIYWLYNFSSSL